MNTTTNESFLAPVSDILDVLDNVEYNHEAAINNLLDILGDKVFEIDWECHHLKSLNYVLLHINTRNLSFDNKKVLNKCLNLLYSVSPENKEEIHLLGQAIDKCFSSLNNQRFFDVFHNLSDFIFSCHQKFLDSHAWTDISYLKKMFLVVEKLCFYLATNKNVTMNLDFFNSIGSIIIELIVKLPLEGTKELMNNALPYFVLAQKNNDYLKEFWSCIRSLSDHSFKSESCLKENASLGKQLFYLCILSDNYISLEPSPIYLPLYQTASIWRIIQAGLIDDNNLNRKFSLYLLKRYIHLLSEFNVAIDSDLLFWSPKDKTYLLQFWDNLFLLLELLEEKQVHLITPALGKVSEIEGLSKEYCVACYSWIICLYVRIISHPSSTILKWGLNNFCKLNTLKLLNDWKNKVSLSCFFKYLNNMFVFDLVNTDGSLQNELRNWFVSIAECDSDGSFSALVLDTVVESAWSPIPLYFIVDALSSSPNKPLWDLKCLKLIERILIETLKTQSIFIRSAIQCRLLKSITLMCKPQIPLECIIVTLGQFKRQESLLRGTGMWQTCVAWLKQYMGPDDGEALFKLCINLLEKEQLPQGIYNSDNINSCARAVVLFKDAGLFPESLVDKLTSTLFEKFSDCKKRVYASTEVQNNYLEFVDCLIKECNVCSMSEWEQDKLLNDIGTNIDILLEFLEFRRGTILTIEVEMYAANLKTILAFKSSADFFPLFKKSFDLLAEPYSTFQMEFFSLKMICVCLQHIANQRCKMDSLNPVVDQLIENIFKKRLFGNVSPILLISSEDLKENNVNGKLMSEIMKTLWQIFSTYLSLGGSAVDTVLECFEINVLTDRLLCAISDDGKSALIPVLQSLAVVLPHNNELGCASQIIKSSWVATFELRKSSLFWPAISQWITMVFQVPLISQDVFSEDLIKYALDIFDEGEELIGLVDTLFTQLSKVNIVPLKYSCLIAKGLVFGPIIRKDRRTEFSVCEYINDQVDQGTCESFGMWMYEIHNDKEVRLKALGFLLAIEDPVARNKMVASVIHELLDMDTLLAENNKRYFNDSAIHRIKHRILQALLLLENWIYNNRSQYTEDIPRKMYDWAFESLQGTNQQPSVRYQLEWLFVRLSLHYTHFLDIFWQVFEQAGNDRPGSICSFISIAYHLAAVLKEKVFIRMCFENTLLWCMSQNFNVRLYSQVVLSKLWDLSPELSKDFKFLKAKQWKIYEQGNVLANAKKMQSDFYFSVFHPIEHFSLQTIYWDLPRLSNISSEEWISVKTILKYKVLETKVTLPRCSSGIAQSLENCVAPTWTNRVTDEVSDDRETINIQKKFIPWKDMLPDREEVKKETKHGVILVASLIDKAANLGGLARTCEIFAAKELVIPSLEILKDKEFTGLSMTAEKHLHITEVKSYNLQDYLKRMKGLGYVIVGLEQTTGSVSLTSFKFPQNCVVLLGNEREGIPVSLIPLLDHCAEIPQLGLIRSLNVHVSGALFLWEYSKQHLSPPNGS